MKTLKLTILVLAGLICLNAYAESFDAVSVDGQPLRCYLNPTSKKIQIEPLTEGYYSGDLVIPNKVEYNGDMYPVAQINGAAFPVGNNVIRSLTIPYSVTSIGILESPTLKKVILEKGTSTLTTTASSEKATFMYADTLIIGRYVDGSYRLSNASVIQFSSNLTKLSSKMTNSMALSEVTIPKNITTIGTSCFSGANLKKVIFEDSNEPIEFSTSTQGTAYTPFANNRVEYLYLGRDINNHSRAFNYVTELVIGDSVTTLPKELCNQNYVITKVSIPNSVSKICTRAFSYCKALKEIELGSGITTIEDDAFLSCSELSDIYCYMPRPIALKSTADPFEYVNKSTCILHVPTAAVEMFKFADVWKDFFVQGLDDGVLEGDVNKDGVVDIADVNRIINIILGLNK